VSLHRAHAWPRWPSRHRRMRPRRVDLGAGRAHAQSHATTNDRYINSHADLEDCDGPHARQCAPVPSHRLSQRPASAESSGGADPLAYLINPQRSASRNSSRAFSSTAMPSSGRACADATTPRHLHVHGPLGRGWVRRVEWIGSSPGPTARSARSAVPPARKSRKSSMPSVRRPRAWFDAGGRRHRHFASVR